MNKKERKALREQWFAFFKERYIDNDPCEALFEKIAGAEHAEQEYQSKEMKTETEDMSCLKQDK